MGLPLQLKVETRSLDQTGDPTVSCCKRYTSMKNTQIH